MEALDHCITDLPIPNRDTLAYLCHHFQKVTESSGHNKMTPEVLARSVAPTIVRRNISTFDGRIEAAKQEQIMLALLRMPHSYWSKLYSPDLRSTKCFSSRILGPSTKQQQQLQVSNDRTPRRYVRPGDHGDFGLSPATAADHSILGPIRTPPSENNGRSVQSLVRRGFYFMHP
uniref:Rho-GAP domain-containing protein n=1 Tax=Syphacia muris TaxID=451379 RepID=A0A0N5AD02_9BILA